MKMSETPKSHLFLDHAIDQLDSGGVREDQIAHNHQVTKQYISRVVCLQNTSMILNLKVTFQEIIHLNANICFVQE